MRLQRFLVPARNHTYSDELIAIGLADLLRELTGGADVTIARSGDAYLIEPQRPLDTDDMPVDAEPYLYIRFDGRDSGAPLSSFDYAKEREREAIWRKWGDQMAKPRTSRGRRALARVTQFALQEDTPPPPAPRSDFAVFKALNSMRKGSTSYADIALAWSRLSSERRRRTLTRRLAALALDLGDDVDLGSEAVPELSGVVRALQFFDPVVGKAAGGAKPDGGAPSSYKSERIDWFEEFLKYRAMHVGLVAYPTGDRGKNTRAFVLAPEYISVTAVRNVRQALLDAPVYGSVQADIRAVLATTEALIRQSEFLRIDDDSPFILFDGRPPDKVLAGLNTAYFLSLGSASAVMNVSFIGLPGWFPIGSAEDANAWLGLLEQFRRATNSLPENRSEHIPILQSMLRCLSSGTIGAALDFFGLYATVQLQSDRGHPRFYAALLRRVFAPMNTTDGPLSGLVGSKGFNAVARAVRQATVTEMHHKSQGHQEYDIRYGLAQEWRRAARVRDEFVNALTKFLSDFEYDAAREQEDRNRAHHRWVRPGTDDLREVVELVDRFGSELVCGLLLAFGFAREPWEQEPSPNANDGGSGGDAE